MFNYFDRIDKKEIVVGIGIGYLLIGLLYILYVIYFKQMSFLSYQSILKNINILSMSIYTSLGIFLLLLLYWFMTNKQ